ncbi:MAG: cation-transporting P-type ATPase [Gammaproteobacteria bacterium]|nr:cation-transporting P-type ATPase [Gammaproteobacteria bacterium]
MHGPNTLPAAKQRNALIRFLSHFNNILIYVLIVTALITLSLQHYFDSMVILAVVVANAIIGFLQEGKAERAMQAIHQILALRAAVLRDGGRVNVTGDALVPGDIVLLEPGDKVPADLRILSSHGLQIQESILTGESVPINKTVTPVKTDAVLGDRHCMAFSGTLVTSGQGRGVVVATGINTEIGRIGGLLNKVEPLTTPLVTQMNRFARWLTVVIIGVALLLLGYGYYVAEFDFPELFMAVVGLSVAAIPEGLPAVLTITLAVGVQAMAKRNAIIRRLPAIETLGSVSVICTDKTGTLTRNEMMVATAVTREHEFSLQGTGYQPDGVISLEGREVSSTDYQVLTELSHIAMLCNDASIHNRAGIWDVEGDPMEGALLAFAGKASRESYADKDRWTRSDTIPFDSKHRFMATLQHNHSGHGFIFVKGAPEQILTMCNFERGGQGSLEPLNLANWQEAADKIAAQGQRVLALAARQVPPDRLVLQQQDVEHEMILVGLVGLIDPPRPEAISAIAECHGAGIQVKMITGDHKGTAAAIGKLIGLENSDHVLTGSELDAISDQELAKRVLDTDIFARTSPEHKLRLVMALQKHDLAVAMTGDGVNDAPALRRADTGIAMGRKGSEAAKEAADFVLADDNFASIVAAIREGRTVYDNIKKVISWTLPTSVGEALIITVALLLGMTLPISPIQILWINLITTTTLGLALAFEPTERSTMQRPPRKRDEPLLGGELAWHIVLVSALFVVAILGIFTYAINAGVSVELARTLSLNSLVVLEIFHLFFIRNIYGTSLTWKAVRGTRPVWITVIAVTAAQFFITYVPLMQTLFETRPVPFQMGIMAVGMGIVFFACVEIEKQIRLRLLGSSAK